MEVSGALGHAPFSITSAPRSLNGRPVPFPWNVNVLVGSLIPFRSGCLVQPAKVVEQSYVCIRYVCEAVSTNIRKPSDAQQGSASIAALQASPIRAWSHVAIAEDGQKNPSTEKECKGRSPTDELVSE